MSPLFSNWLLSQMKYFVDGSVPGNRFMKKLKRCLFLSVFVLVLFAGTRPLDFEPLAVERYLQGEEKVVEKPIMDLRPKELHVWITDNPFPQAEVSVLNQGVGELMIRSVKPSCDCASATVLKSSIYPMEVGKVRVAVNAKGLSDTLSHLDFVFESNASNSPQIFKFWIHKKE